MNRLRWTPLGLVVWQLFMSLQLGSGSPFFGVSVQGGFRTEGDIATAARAVGLVLESTQQSMATLSARMPFSVAAQDTTAGAVLQLYGILVSQVASFTDRIGWAAVNTTNTPAEVFLKLGSAYDQSVAALTGVTVNATVTVASYSPAIGAQLSNSREAILLILKDINGTLVKFQQSVEVFPVPITAQAVFENLNKFQIATIVGALEALQAEVTTVVGKLQETAITLVEADTLMASYVAMLTQSFSNIDGSLTNLRSTLTKVSAEFTRQFRASESTVAAGVKAFNDRLSTFTDDIIGVGATQIRSITEPLGQRFSEVYSILMPNVEEQLQLLADTATDDVLSAAQNQLFITYRILDSAIGRIPIVPSQGRGCAVAHISPYVQYVASNMAQALIGCISSTGGQAEAVLRVQQQSIETLVRDRLAYVKLWNDALAGVSSTSDATIRRIAYAKLSAQTSNQNLDTLQPALASSFSMYAQLVSNLKAVLNRANLCLTLKSAELSAQLVSTATNFNTCLQS